MQPTTTEQYLKSLGTVFEKYLNQDSGNKCYSLLTDAGRVWVKILNLESTPLTDLHGLISFYNSCDSEMIPKNWKLIELIDNVLMQHDWVPGRVINSPDENRYDATSTYSKFMELSVEKRIYAFEKILDFFVYLESRNIIVEDFYDGCILYDFEKDNLYLCDLDHIHIGSYRLLRDRQYGSRRFMAPEEFQKGETIDRRTSVYTMGATGFNLLNRNKREPSEWSLPQELYMILKRAVSDNKLDRYASVSEFHKAWGEAK